MKNLIYPFIAIIVLATSNTTFAQVKFGIRGGLNLTNMLVTNSNNKVNEFKKLKPGFQLGVTSKFIITEKLSLESGLLFSTKGFKDKFPAFPVTTFNVNYLELPIHAVYKIHLGKTNLLIQAGPYIAYALSGKGRTDSNNSSSDDPLIPSPVEKEWELKIGNDKQDFIKPLDWGLNIGTAVEFKHLTMGLQYGISLADISTNGYNKNVTRNSVFSILLGYTFGKKNHTTNGVN